jgi:hypothetical protein
VTTRCLVAAVATTAVLGLTGAACQYGGAPRCTSDTDCELGRHCIESAGICVGFDTPLLPAPDASPDGLVGDGGTPAEGGATDGGADAVGDAPGGAG